MICTSKNDACGASLALNLEGAPYARPSTGIQLEGAIRQHPQVESRNIHAHLDYLYSYGWSTVEQREVWSGGDPAQTEPGPWP